MKKIPFIALCFWMYCQAMPTITYAQADTTHIRIPMKDHKITYESTGEVTASKALLFKKAVEWLGETFQGIAEGKPVLDEKNGTVKGKGLFKVITSASGNYYWLRFDVLVTVSDTGYTYVATNYYEKPIEKGITNEYSKIEYRWWDYRQGHPWSVEDKALFTGLHEHSQAIVASLKEALSR